MQSPAGAVTLVGMLDALALWDDSLPRTPAGHMAADEVVFLTATLPVLRVYRWSAAAVTFGYGQRISLVRELAPGVPCVRRWTGEGLFSTARISLSGWRCPGRGVTPRPCTR